MTKTIKNSLKRTEELALSVLKKNAGNLTRRSAGVCRIFSSLLSVSISQAQTKNASKNKLIA